ncbi:hypothetical protein IFM89_040007 [Coptis chinensis]|uniref:Uncharacterized protein n=1 Tax=Coptis chinensis TaxID=261450 RepID=A0A835GVA3_9MAGN|nr:hypothetical protein IFM89_040007 [Coptis chinensis]
MVSLWKHRNKVCFEEETVSLSKCQLFITSQVSYARQFSKGHMWGNGYDKEVAMNWGVLIKLGRAPKMRECEWLAPHGDIIKINSDSASRGNQATRA